MRLQKSPKHDSHHMQSKSEVTSNLNSVKMQLKRKWNLFVTQQIQESQVSKNVKLYS